MKNKNYQFNIIFLIMGAISLIILIILSIVFFSLKNIGEKELGLSAQTVAMATAISIMDDIDEYEEFLKTKDVNSEYYQKMQNYLAKIKASGNINFLYTLERIGENEVIYVLDAEPIGSENYSAPKDTEDERTTKEYIETFNNKLPIIMEGRSYESWGNLITSYAPIYNNDGSLIGLVGADIDAERFLGYFTNFFIIMILAFIILFLLIVIALLKILPDILEPLIKDKLTNAYNKRYYEDHLKKEIEQVLKHCGLVTIMMLDLDHFKKVNDTYGHLFGDKVLTTVASLINKSLRSNDYLIRYGGEEFIVILTRTKMRNSITIAQRIRTLIEKTPIFNKEKNKDINITISIGIADSQNRILTVDELVNNADTALYVAKKNRNEVSVFKDQ